MGRRPTAAILVNRPGGRPGGGSYADPRRGRTKSSPAQFGQTWFSCPAQVGQKVHSYEQMKAAAPPPSGDEQRSQVAFISNVTTA